MVKWSGSRRQTGRGCVNTFVVTKCDANVRAHVPTKSRPTTAGQNSTYCDNAEGSIHVFFASMFDIASCSENK